MCGDVSSLCFNNRYALNIWKMGSNVKNKYFDYSLNKRQHAVIYTIAWLIYRNKYNYDSLKQNYYYEIVENEESYVSEIIIIFLKFFRNTFDDFPYAVYSCWRCLENMVKPFGNDEIAFWKRVKKNVYFNFNI